jgi:hypothetical protein
MKRKLRTWKQLMLLAVAILVLRPTPAAGQMEGFDQAKTRPDRMLSLALTSRGFSPNSVGIKPGKVALIILNRTLIENLTVTVTKEGAGGVALSSQHTPKSRDAWHFVVVQPGTYHLMVAEQPAWTCTLTVDPK